MLGILPTLTSRIIAITSHIKSAVLKKLICIYIGLYVADMENASTQYLRSAYIVFVGRNGMPLLS